MKWHAYVACVHLEGHPEDIPGGVVSWVRLVLQVGIMREEGTEEIAGPLQR